MDSSIYKYLLYAICFVDLFAVGLVVPLMSMYLKSLGASNLVLGLIGSTYSGVQIVSGPLIGSCSDAWDRKLVLSFTLVICSLTYFLTSLTTSIFVIFLLRLILGTVKHTQSITKAMASDAFPNEQQAEVLGRLTAFGSIGFIVGPLLGGYLSESSNGGYPTVCFLTSLLFVINTVLVYCLPSTKPATTTKPTANIDLSYFKSQMYKVFTDAAKLDWKNDWRIMVMRYFFGLSLSMFFFSQSMYLQEQFELNQRQIGATISLLSAFSTFSSFVMNYITKYFYKNDLDCSKRMFHFFVILAISSIGVYISSNYITYVIFLIPFSMSGAVLRISSLEVMLTNCEESKRGTYAGVSNSIMSFSRFSTPVLTGAIGDTFGTDIFMFLPCIPATVGSVLAYDFYGKNVRRRKS